METMSKRHSWRISIRAKSRGFDLDLRADNILPHWGNGGEKVSIALRLRQFFLLNVTSENGASTRRRPPASRLLRFMKKIFRPRRGRQQAKRNRESAAAHGSLQARRNGESVAADRSRRLGFLRSNAIFRFLSVACSKISTHIGRNWMIWLIILALLPFFSYKFRRMILFRIIKHVIKRAPFSIPNMLLNLTSLLPLF